MKDLLALKDIPSEMGIDVIPENYVFTFTNTGRRGHTKHFEISLSSLIQTLKDIQNNYPKFVNNASYEEKTWRELFSNYLTDEAVNALAGVQTLPLFVVINKIICLANNLIDDYKEKTMPFTQQNVDNAVDFLEEYEFKDDKSSSHKTVQYDIPEGGLATKPEDGDDNLQDIDENILAQRFNAASDIVGENRIYYGAPGTGKSFVIDSQIARNKNIRTVFHSDTQYGDFVGCLKPTMNNDKIEYSFSPGAFTTAIIDALNDPDNHYYLTIEELNRAPAAAVFGDIFQLLDRDENGKSSYSIDITDRDWLRYLNSHLKNPLQAVRLRIPSNLSIFATMNSSDQAVLPLDTAFKRRWVFHYQALDFENPNVPVGIIPLAKGQNGVEWSRLAQSINSILTEHNVPEDRLLGPWFISEKEISTDDGALQTLIGKILNYIWDDVLRHRPRDIIFKSDIKTFAQLCQEINEGKYIYSDELLEKLKDDEQSEILS